MTGALYVCGVPTSQTDLDSPHIKPGLWIVGYPGSNRQALTLHAELTLLRREIRQGYNPAGLCHWRLVQHLLPPEVN
jgi:hypothetical protein